MQVKALVIFTCLLAAVALAACGGGGDSSSTSTSTSTRGSAAPQLSAGLKQLHRRADRIRRERQQQSGGEERHQVGKSHGSPAPAGQAAQVEVHEQHHDSGGGVAQFRSKGGDESIQELGQEGSSSEMKQAAAALHAYLDARAKSHWDTACLYLSADLIAALEQFAESSPKPLKGCPSILATLNASASQAALEESAEADVGALRQQGEQGFLLFHGPHGLDYAMPVHEEAATWKLASLEATPLP